MNYTSFIEEHREELFVFGNKILRESAHKLATQLTDGSTSYFVHYALLDTLKASPNPNSLPKLKKMLPTLLDLVFTRLVLEVRKNTKKYSVDVQRHLSELTLEGFSALPSSEFIPEAIAKQIVRFALEDLGAELATDCLADLKNAVPRHITSSCRLVNRQHFVVGRLVEANSTKLRTMLQPRYSYGDIEDHMQQVATEMLQFRIGVDFKDHEDLLSYFIGSVIKNVKGAHKKRKEQSQISTDPALLVVEDNRSAEVIERWDELERLRNARGELLNTARLSELEVMILSLNERGIPKEEMHKRLNIKQSTVLMAVKRLIEKARPLRQRMEGN